MTENAIRVLEIRKIVPIRLIGVIDIEQEVACAPLGLELKRVVMSTAIGPVLSDIHELRERSFTDREGSKTGRRLVDIQRIVQTTAICAYIGGSEPDASHFLLNGYIELVNRAIARSRGQL